MKSIAAVLLTLSLILPSALARDSVSAAEVNGTFRSKTGSEFRIWALGGKLQVEFHGIHPYKTPQGEDTANMGFASGTIALDGDTAVLKPEGFDECAITLTFTKPGVLDVQQEGYNCGFGNRVTADGAYRKVSSDKPTFGEEDN